jgi:NitT/TauT family transport system ATP-binding protein/sulfonate transport system ATP-binding protein
MAERSGKMVGFLTIEDVSKTFKLAEGEEVQALNGVNLSIEHGEFVTLIGPSGCGKSTLLRCIAGLHSADSGILKLDGEVISAPSYERGLVFQDPTLFPWLTIRDNVAFSLRARKLYQTDASIVDELLNLVGLMEFASSYPHQLSGGMAQRASLARALASRPKLLLLDEPLGALDAFTRMNMQDEILAIHKKQKTTIVMVTHDVDEAIYLSDRVVVMSPRPAKIEETISIELTRPRSRNHPDFLQMRSNILEILDYAGKPSEPSYYL